MSISQNIDIESHEKHFKSTMSNTSNRHIMYRKCDTNIFETRCTDPDQPISNLQNLNKV